MRNLVKLVCATLVLAGCSGPIETRIHSAGDGVTGPITVLADETALSPAAVEAQRRVQSAISARVGIAPGAPTHHLSVALSERPAMFALSVGNAQGERAIAPAKTRKPFQNCADREIRVSIILTSISDGREEYRGEAAEYHCKATVEEVMPHLVDAALRNFPAANGRSVLRRSGRD